MWVENFSNRISFNSNRRQATWLVALSSSVQVMISLWLSQEWYHPPLLLLQTILTVNWPLNLILNWLARVDRQRSYLPQWKPAQVHRTTSLPPQIVPSTQRSTQILSWHRTWSYTKIWVQSGRLHCIKVKTSWKKNRPHRRAQTHKNYFSFWRGRSNQWRVQCKLLHKWRPWGCQTRAPQSLSRIATGPKPPPVKRQFHCRRTFASQQFISQSTRWQSRCSKSGPQLPYRFHYYRSLPSSSHQPPQNRYHTLRLEFRTTCHHSMWSQGIQNKSTPHRAGQRRPCLMSHNRSIGSRLTLCMPASQCPDYQRDRMVSAERRKRSSAWWLSRRNLEKSVNSNSNISNSTRT